MDYPTREQVLDMMNCFNNICRECKAYKPLCYTTREDRASAWMNVLDALDAKQAELDKAHNLIRRMANEISEELCDKDECKRCPPFIKLINEAEAMTKGT